MSGDIEDFVEAAGLAEQGATLTEAQSLALYNGAPEIVALARTLRQTIYAVERLLADPAQVGLALELIKRYDQGDVGI